MVKLHKQVLTGVKNYEKFGAEGLTREKKNKSYSDQFKLDVL